MGELFNTLQVYLGSLYVNDFNRFGRPWQVKVQADASDRKGVDDIFRVRVRTAQGDLIPLRAVADVGAHLKRRFQRLRTPFNRTLVT